LIILLELYIVNIYFPQLKIPLLGVEIHLFKLLFVRIENGA